MKAQEAATNMTCEESTRGKIFEEWGNGGDFEDASEKEAKEHGPKRVWRRQVQKSDENSLKRASKKDPEGNGFQNSPKVTLKRNLKMKMP